MIYSLGRLNFCNNTNRVDVIIFVSILFASNHFTRGCQGNYLKRFVTDNKDLHNTQRTAGKSKHMLSKRILLSVA